MLNEQKEFEAYTGKVNYTATNKHDTTYLGRFTFDGIIHHEGLARVYTMLVPYWILSLSTASLSSLVQVWGI